MLWAQNSLLVQLINSYLVHKSNPAYKKNETTRAARDTLSIKGAYYREIRVGKSKAQKRWPMVIPEKEASIGYWNHPEGY